MIQESFSWDKNPAGQAHARTSDPPTSHEAAQAMRDKPATQLELSVLDALRIEGPSTSEEVAERLGISLQSISPRFKPLERRGLIVRTTEKRAGASGRARIVWKAV